MTSFVRHTLYARDPERASTFYRELLGWAIDSDGRCTGGDAADIRIERSQAPPRVPSFWAPFLGVTDVDAAVGLARALGARVLWHTPGAEAFLVDPRGAVVGLCLGGERTGVFAWDELLTDDPDAAAAFYAALGGLTVDTIDRGPAGPYHLLHNGPSRVAGVMKHPAGLHPHWQPYFSVDDVDATTGRAIGLGATAYFAPCDLPGFGRMSAVDDPVGAGICFLRPSGGRPL